MDLLGGGEEGVHSNGGVFGCTVFGVFGQEGDDIVVAEVVHPSYEEVDYQV